MTGIFEIVIAAAGTGVIGTALGHLSGHLTARRRAKSAEVIADRKATASEAIASQIHDERVAPPLLERIKLLETRLDERDDAVERLHVQAGECEEGRNECKRELGELRRHVDELEGEQRSIRTSIESGTPPGAWRVGKIDADPSEPTD